MGHHIGRRLVFLALAGALLSFIIWFVVKEVATGEVRYWFDEFRYRQDNLIFSVRNAWHFPWE